MCELTLPSPAGSTNITIDHDPSGYVTVRIDDPLAGGARLTFDREEFDFFIESLIRHGLGAFVL